MTNTILLKKIQEAAKHLDEHESNSFNFWLEHKHEKNLLLDLGGHLADLYNTVYQAEQERLNKQTGKQNISKVAKAIASAATFPDAQNKALKYEDKFFFADGFRLLLAADSFGFEHSDKCEGLYRLIAKMNVNPPPFTFELNNADIKMCIAEHKAVKKKNDKPFATFKIEHSNGKVYGFNAQYLLDAITATGDTTIMLPEEPLNPAYMRGDKAEMIILPVRLKEENNATNS